MSNDAPIWAHEAKKLFRLKHLATPSLVLNWMDQGEQQMMSDLAQRQALDRRIKASAACGPQHSTTDIGEVHKRENMNLNLGDTNIHVSSLDEANSLTQRNDNVEQSPAQVVSSPREAGPGPRPEPAPVATPTDEERAYEHHRNNERIVADQSRRIEEVQRENDRLREEMRDERKQLEELKKNGVGGDVHNPNPAWTSVREDSPLTKIPIVEKLVGG